MSIELLNAIKEGNLKLCSDLIDRGADVNFSHLDETPLKMAISQNRAEIVKLLLSRKADPNQRFGKIPISILAFCLITVREDYAVQLIEAGARVDGNDILGLTPLTFAISQKLNGVAKHIIQSKKIDINKLMDKEVTYLMLSFARKNDEIAKCLLESGADPNHRGLQGQTPLISAVLSNNLKAVEILAACSNIKLNLVDNQGNTALNQAVQNSNTEMVRFLLKVGADQTIADNHGELPFIRAQYFGDKEIIELLRQDLLRRKLNQETMFQDPFLQDCKTIKDAGHILGMEAKIKVKRSDNGEFVDVPTIKRNYQESTDLLVQCLNDYLKQGDLALFTKVHFLIVHNNFKLERSFLEHDNSISLETKLKHYQAGNLLIVETGWVVHGCAVILYKDFLLLCNRGSGVIGTGMAIYKIKDISLINEQWLRTLNLPAKERTHKVFKQQLELVVDLKTPYVEFPTTPQKWGTCTFVNLKSAIEGMIFLIKQEMLLQTLATELTLGSELNKVKSESEIPLQILEKVKQEALAYARQEYKRFSAFIRDTKLNQLIEEANHTHSFLRKHVRLDLLVAYLGQHYGQSRKETRDRSKKMIDEIQRAKRILYGLDKYGLEYVKKRIIPRSGQFTITPPLLSNAISGRDFKFISFLVKLGFDINESDCFGDTIFIKAIKNKDERMVDFLLRFKQLDVLAIKSIYPESIRLAISLELPSILERIMRSRKFKQTVSDVDLYFSKMASLFSSAMLNTMIERGMVSPNIATLIKETVSKNTAKPPFLKESATFFTVKGSRNLENHSDSLTETKLLREEEGVFGLSLAAKVNEEMISSTAPSLSSNALATQPEKQKSKNKYAGFNRGV